MRLQLHALAYNLGNLLRTLATPELIKNWSLTTLREKLIKIGAKVIRHGRYIAFQMAEVAIPQHMFQEILGSSPNCGRSRRLRQHETADGHTCNSDRQEDCARCRGKWTHPAAQRPSGRRGMAPAVGTAPPLLPKSRKSANIQTKSGFIWGIPVHNMAFASQRGCTAKR